MRGMNRDDLIIILKLAVHMAKADEDLSVLEKQIVGHLVEKIGLSGEERAEIGVLGEEPERIAERLSSSEAKAFLIKTLCAISKSDGILHYTENQLLTRINEALGMPVALRPWEEWMHYETEVMEVMNRS